MIKDNMLLFDENGKPYNTDKYKKILYKNNNCEIYINNNILLKIVKNPLSKEFEKIVKIINKYNLKHFVKINNLYYDNNHNIIAYEMNYAYNTIINILEMPTRYISENYIELFNEILILTNENILLNDLSLTNIVLNCNDIVIIDIDDYEFNNDINNKNINLLNSTFIELFIKTSYFYINNETLEKIKDLFSKSNSEIMQILDKYQYIIDYITETKNLTNKRK